MITALFAIIGIFLTICFVVGTHEYAHFQVARWCGVQVNRFSIGFGKPLFKWRDKKKTEFVFALIPLGGYVDMLGENKEIPLSEKEKKHSYNHQPFYKKFLIIAAGPLCNFLCAIFLYWVIFTVGFQTVKPIIGVVTPNSIAANAGLSKNQQIVSIDGRQTRTWMRVIYELLAHTGDKDTITLTTVSGDNPALDLHTLNLKNWKMNDLTPDPFGSLGFQPDSPAPLASKAELKRYLQTIKYNPLTALPAALDETWQLTYFNLILFQKMFTGKLSLDSLGGPVTIFSTAGEALNHGALSFMSFLAFLSVTIGLVNLFPIPGLDGGHLFFQLIEAVIRRPLPEKLVFFLYRLGIAFLFIIMIRAVVNDVLRLI